jgi:hypothetical protein
VGDIRSSGTTWRLEEYWRLNQTFHVFGPVLIGSLIVNIEPTGKDASVTRIGRMVYPTREEAEAEVKRLCK